VERELNYGGSKPLLYLVATPIGNLSEFPPRAAEVLSSMDFIACEDTRNSGLLLKRFHIDKPLISCHEHNEEAASEKIVKLLRDGKKVAYVSDAGYPGLSDPGQRLADRCINEGIKIAVINGPNAALCGLIGSGLDTSHFYFYGFLPSKPSERKKELERNTAREETMIFYEAPHRISDTLQDLAAVFGDSRRACLCRELTKTHEEYIRATLGELAKIDGTTLIGEMVLVVEGQKEQPKPLGDEDIVRLLIGRLKTQTPKEAVASLSKENALPKNRVYEIYLRSVKKS
jgi:16S rRNA (cytidine1402-2'-O)-methyltransferase